MHNTVTRAQSSVVPAGPGDTGHTDMRGNVGTGSCDTAPPSPPEHPHARPALFTVFTDVVPSELNNYIITTHVWGGSGGLRGWAVSLIRCIFKIKIKKKKLNKTK